MVLHKIKFYMFLEFQYLMTLHNFIYTKEFFHFYFAFVVFHQSFSIFTQTNMAKNFPLFLRQQFFFFNQIFFLSFLFLFGEEVKKYTYLLLDFLRGE